MVKRGGLPGRSSVAGGTSLAHAALVRIIIGMTGITVAGRSLENVVDMTAGTSRTDMRTR